MALVRNVFTPALLLAALTLSGCEEIVTGEPADTIAVSENAAGGYGPVTLTLAPDMAPAAINFRAEHGTDPAELNKWNSYRAVLSHNGQPVAAGAFNVNHTGTIDSPQGAPYLVEHMLTVYPPLAGNYELSITPTKPVEVALSRAEVQVRRNVQNSRAR